MNGYWMKKGADHTILSEEMYREITESKKSVIVLEGPSGCGKTRILESLPPKDKITLSATKLDNAVYDFMLGMTEEEYAASFDGYDTVCFEDVDIVLRGKEATQGVFAQAVKLISKNSAVVITGIELSERLGTVYSHIGELMDAYTFVETE